LRNLQRKKKKTQNYDNIDFTIKFDQTKVNRIIDGFCSCKGDCQECKCKTTQHFCEDDCECDKTKCKNKQVLNTTNIQQPLKIKQFDINKTN